MDFDIFVLDRTIDIEAASPKRQWMDALPDRYGYRCLPMTLANSFGWVLKCPIDVRASWNGGPDQKDLVIEAGGAERSHPFAVSHFGAGIITFHTGILIKTPADFQVRVSGPPNTPRKGVQALTAIVPNDWLHVPFTMNWKITQPGTAVFAKGSPFCFFHLIQTAVSAEAQPRLRQIEDDPEAKRALDDWAASRADFLDDLSRGCPEAQSRKWQKSMIEGAKDAQIPLGQGVTKLRMKDPK